MNLVEFPFSLPANRHPKDRDTIHVSINGTDSQQRPVNREWVVTGSQKHGLPLAIDEEILLGLFHLWQRDDFKERSVWFTQYSLFKLLGWSLDARSYHRLERVMDRLLGLSIKSHQTFWDNKGKCHVTDGFGLVDSYRLWRRDSQSADHPFLSRVTFSEFLYDSILAGYIKTLDLNFYLSLRFPLARKLYRFLDKRSYKKSVVEMSLQGMADRLAMADSASPSRVKANLQNAHQELIDRGFLKSIQYTEKAGKIWIRYMVVPKSMRDKIVTAAIKEDAPSFPENPLATELASRGITRDVAATLVEGHGEKIVADQIEAFDFLTSRNSPQLSKNPAGYLRCAIEGNFASPAGFVSKADRERKRHDQEAAGRRKIEAKEAEERAERETFAWCEEVWQSLQDDERSSIKAEVLESLRQLNPRIVQTLEKENAEGRESIAHWTFISARNQILSDRHRETDAPDATDGRTDERQSSGLESS